MKNKSEIEKPLVEIFSDGACRENPGPGGWGVLLRSQGIEKHLSGSEPFTTNNRMELTASIEGLSALKLPCAVIITTDSKYVMDGITSWISNWKRNGWKTKEKSLVKNIDLWKKLDVLIEKHQVEWKWIKGHTGHRENEMADKLATQAIDSWIQDLIELPLFSYKK